MLLVTARSRIKQKITTGDANSGIDSLFPVRRPVKFSLRIRKRKKQKNEGNAINKPTDIILIGKKSRNHSRSCG